MATLVANKPMHIIISGAACSGKGTQCELIKSKYNLIHLSTGDMLRTESAARTELGLIAQEYMNKGELIPDQLIIKLVKSRIQQEDCQKQGWLLDGFPRTAIQAQALLESNIIPDLFIVLQVPDSVLIERVTGRRLDPVTSIIYHIKYNMTTDEQIIARLIQRSDDTIEKITVRLAAYNDQVTAIESHYSKIIAKIDGNRDKMLVFADIDKSIQKLQEIL